MRRFHWKFGIIAMFATSMGMIAIGDSCNAQGNRGGGDRQGGGKRGGGNQGGGNQGGGNQGGGNQGGGNQGGGNQGGGNQGGGNQRRGNDGFRGGGNFNGGIAPQGGPHTGGGGSVQNQLMRPPSFGGNQAQKGPRSPSLNQPTIRIPNVPNGISQGIRINPNVPINGIRPNRNINPIGPNGVGRIPIAGQNTINQTVHRPNIGDVENRFYNGNNLNAGVGLYQPAYARHSGYHGSWNGNRGLQGSYNNNGFYGGSGNVFGLGGGYGISNGNWGYGNNIGNLYGAGYGGYGGYGYRPLGWGLGGWGLGSLIYNSGYLGYSNPYYVNSNASVYNYAQPIPVTYNTTNSTIDVGSNPVDQIFADAVAAFKRNDYDAALDLTNHGITQYSDDAVLHELRSLIYFAHGDYQNAASTIHSVLAVGPGWDWTTLVSMYSDVAVYTEQLRTLESYVRNNPKDAASQFLLAYQYMSCGHADSAAIYLNNVVQLMPTDQVAIDLKQMLASSNSNATSNPALPPAPSGDHVPKGNLPAFQSEALLGTWHASRDDKSQFVLTLENESRFTWSFTPPGQAAQSFQGSYTLENDVLSLNRKEGGTLVASLSQGSPKQFNFKLIGAPKEDQGLTFVK